MSEEKKELPACPVETTLMLIGDKWKVLILRDLAQRNLPLIGDALAQIVNVVQRQLE